MQENEPQILIDLGLAEVNGWIVVYSGIHIEQNMPIDEFITWIKTREEDIHTLIEAIREFLRGFDTPAELFSSRVVLTTMEDVSVMGSILIVDSVPAAKELMKVLDSDIQINFNKDKEEDE